MVVAQEPVGVRGTGRGRGGGRLRGAARGWRAGWEVRQRGQAVFQLLAGEAPVEGDGGVVVHDPEDARGGAVGLLPQHLGDEQAEGGEAGRRVAAADHPAAPHLPGGQGRQGPARVCSCSARIAWPGRGGVVGAMRTRALWRKIAILPPVHESP